MARQQRKVRRPAEQAQQSAPEAPTAAPRAPEPPPKVTRPATGNGAPVRLTGSPQSYQDIAERTQFKGGARANFLADPDVRAAIAVDKEIEKDLEAELDASVEDADEALEMLVESSLPEDGHEFANGVS